MAAPPRVSLCVIARNEERNISACLRPFQGLVHEIVVVDTGSTDATKRLAVEQGSRVFDFPWCDDFSAARNEAIRHATGDYIFWMDADDRIDDANLAKFKNLLASLNDTPAAYMMTCVCEVHETGEAELFTHCRLFPRRADIRWRYRIHEQIAPAIEQAGIGLIYTDIDIHHVGYLDAAENVRKHNRNRRLLRMQFATHPDDAWLLYQFGMACLRDGQSAEALSHFLKGLKVRDPRIKGYFVRDLYSQAGSTLNALDRPEEALAILRMGLEEFPGDATLVSTACTIFLRVGDMPSAERLLVELLSKWNGEDNRVDNLHSRGIRECQRLLGWIYQDTGRYREAEHLFQEILARQPDLASAWMGLAYTYLAVRKFSELEFVIRQMEKLPDGALFASVLRGERAAAEGDMANAMTLLRHSISTYPQQAWPRFVYMRLLLSSGAALPLCKDAFRELVRLDPNNRHVMQQFGQQLEERERQETYGSSYFSFVNGPLTFT